MKTAAFIFYILIISFNPFHAQKNRYQHFFNEVDSLKSKEQQVKRLEQIHKDKKLNTTEKIAFYKRIIPTTIEIQKYVVALKYAFDAEKLAKEIKDDTLLCYFINQIGGTYYYIGDKNKAIYYFKKSYKIAEKGNYWKTAAMTSSNIGALSIEKGDSENAEYYLKKAIEIFKKHHIDRKEGLLSYRLLATLYSQDKQYVKARPIFEEIILISKQIKDTTMICSSLIYYANFLSGVGNHKEAIRKLEESLALQRTQVDKPTLITNLAFLAQTLYNNGEFKKAFELENEAFNLNRKIFQADLKNGIAETEVKYKTAEIKQQKELAESKALAEHRKNNLYVLIFLGLILMLTIAFLLVYFGQLNKRRKYELKAQKELIESVVKAQEEEKVRIARDLHDGICQKFAATKMKFSTLGAGLSQHQPAMEEKYKVAVSLLDEATNELRGIAHEIMPPALNQKGLIDALRLLSAQTFSDQLIYTFEVFGTPFEFTESEEINVYRMVQELFANIVRHANATEVSVQLIFSGTTFSLLIEDNGTGIPDSAIFGAGIKNLKLRSEIIHAKFILEKGPKNGTFSSITLTK